MSKFLLFLFVVLLSINISAQSASSVWSLTANQSASVTGNITGADQSLSNMQITYSSGVQRSSPTPTAGTWPGESVENSTRYMQFSLSPNSGYSFTTTSISMNLYVNSGSSMRANVYYSVDSTFATKTQIGTTFNLSSTVPGTPNITASPSVSIGSGESFYVRIYPWYTVATTGKYVITNNVSITGTTVSLISVFPSVSNISGLIQTSSAPSPLQNFSLTGTGLTSNVIVTAPSNFEISTDNGSTWNNSSTPVSLPVSGGVITGEPVLMSVRLNGPTSAEYNDTIKITSTGATDAFVIVSGVYVADEPTLVSMVSFGTVTGNSMVINFTGGNGAKRVVIARNGSAVDWIPSDANPVYGVNNIYSQALDQGNGNKAIYDGTGNSVNVSGLTSNSTYYVAVYEYNVGGGNSQNYLSSGGTGNNTTLTVPELSVNPSSILFTSGVINKDTLIQSYTLSGSLLSGSGNITVSVPAGVFSISLSELSGYTQSIDIPYLSGTLNSTTIFVRFIPTVASSYSDTISNIGGGALTVKIPVTGKGVATIVETNEPVGFATLNGGTTGGISGAPTDSVFYITSATQLASIMKYREGRLNSRATFYITGTLTGYSTEISVKRTSNVSILGVGTDAGFLGFGMKIVDCQNVIVRNLKFADCHVDEKDGLSIDGSTNVWVDHCSFTDSPANDPSGSSHDGQLDVKNGAYYVTISYNHFQNHRKTCLLGHTSGQVSDSVMKVTYYRNWFDGTYSRHPRIRFAKAHLLNNLYSSTSGYGVGVTCNAQVMLEANYFEGTSTPALISGVNDPLGTLSHDPQGWIKSLNNYTTGSGSIVENLGSYYFNPLTYYTYNSAEASLVKSIVMENAGSGILNINPMPVELVSFKGYLKNDYAVLNWSTASEVNNFGFEIEKRTSGKDWVKVGFVSGNGTTQLKHNYSFKDRLIEKQAFYRLRQIDIDGNFIFTNEVEISNKIPVSYALDQNYPNPFNPSTTIRFSLPVESRVVIRLYNILGEQVALLLDKELGAGKEEINFTSGNFGSGVYLYSLEAHGKDNSIFRSTRKMLLMK